MGGRYNGAQPDITFEADTPRGAAFLLSLQQRARNAELFEPRSNFGQRWNALEQTVNVRKNRAVPVWTVYGPPISRPLAPLRAQSYAKITTLGLWEQMQKNKQPMLLLPSNGG